MEFLEERTLLSAMPLTSGEYTELTSKYSAIALPETMDDLNIITLDLAEGDGLTELRSAIETAGTTEKSDLIVVRTSADANTLTYTSSTDALSISINSSAYGSLTIVGLGDTPLTLDAAQLSSVLSVTGSTTNLTIANLTLTGGSANSGGGIYSKGATVTVTDSEITGNTASQYGGGIYSSGTYATLTVTDSEITGNTAFHSGGGIYVDYGTYTITDSTITGNTAKYDGGGIYGYYGTYTITDSTITGNTASDDGGGIYVDHGTYTITDSTITGNTAKYYGGGIYGYSGTYTITNTRISENRAEYVGTGGESGKGGGIYNTGTLQLINSEVVSNTAHSSYTGTNTNGTSQAYGGGIYNTGTLTVTNSTIAGNTASWSNSKTSSNTGAWGGGIYNTGSSGTFTLTNTVITGNTANYGGGIYNSATSKISYIYHSTIADNIAEVGGGLWNNYLLYIYNTIIADNGTETANGRDIWTSDTDNARTMLTNSLVSRGEHETGKDFFHGGSLIGTAESPISAGFADAANGDYHLSAGSAAIDAGNDLITLPETDADEAERLQGRHVDMGAYEFTQLEYVGTQETASTVVTTEKDIVDAYDGQISLREAIEYAENGDTITFNVAGNRVEVYTRITIGKELTISGTSPENRTVIDGLGITDILTIAENVGEVTLEALTLSGGFSSMDGGGLYIYGGNNAAVIDSLITKNRANNISGSYDGGGICNVSSSLSLLRTEISENSGGGIYSSYATVTVTDSEITGNTANGTGSGIYSNGGAVTVTDSEITGNTAKYYGGGIYSNGTITVTDSEITGNTAQYGGGIYSNGGTITVTDSEITGNTAQYGGGIYGDSGTYTITGSEITGNTASQYGGGIYGYSGTYTITDSEITGNTASQYGGGIYGYFGTYTITNTRISENRAEYVGTDNRRVEGGGIYNRYGTLKLTNSEVVSNTAHSSYTGTSTNGTSQASGGGIYNTGTLTVTNSTIAGNTASWSNSSTTSSNTGAWGGGIYNTGSKAKLYNTIVAENTAENGADVYASTALTGSNNLSTYEGWGLDTNYLYDPNLSLFKDKERGDFSLVPNMQAFDRGSNEHAANAGIDETWTDLAGNERFQNAAIDIGAYETAGLSISQNQIFQGTVDFAWLDYEGAESVKITWIQSGSTTVLGTFAAIGEYHWDTTQTANGAGQLRVEYFDAAGKTVLNSAWNAVVLNSANIEVHRGTVTETETWSKDKVHIVVGRMNLKDGASVTVEAGTVVKFAKNSWINTENGTMLTVGDYTTFTRLEDDTVGGDTNLDGGNSVPQFGNAYIRGNVNFELGNVTMKFVTTTTTTSGTITQSETWYAGVYHVTDNLTVASGATLTLMPGVILKFDPGCQLTVNSGATLNAKGNNFQPIVFTSVKDDSYGGDTNEDENETEAAAGDWSKIYCNGGNILLDHCVIQYCSDTNNNGGIYINGGTVEFNNSRISHTEYDAMRNNGGTFTANNSIFEDSSMALRPSGGETIVTNCTIANVTTAVRGTAGQIRNTIFYNVTDIIFDWGTIPTYNCCFYNQPGLGTQSTSEVGKNGNIWADPLFRDAANGDYHLMAGSPCIDAADGSVAPKTDKSGIQRVTDIYSTPTGIADSDGNYADIGAFEFAEGTQGNIDLEIISAAGPQSVSIGDKVTISWTLKNNGTAAAKGVWTDSVYLVSEGGQKVLASNVSHSGNITSGDLQTFYAEVTIPQIASGNWYIAVEANTSRSLFEGSLIENNNIVSAAATFVDVPTLTFPTESITLPAKESKLYKVIIPANEEYYLVCNTVQDDKSDYKIIGLTARDGFVPTDTLYDWKSSTTVNGYTKTNESNWQDTLTQLYIPAADHERTVYLDITQLNGHDAAIFDIARISSDFSLKRVDMAVGSVDINDIPVSRTVSYASTVSVRVAGTGFKEGMTAALIPGLRTCFVPIYGNIMLKEAPERPVIYASKVNVISGCEAILTFEMPALGVHYDINDHYHLQLNLNGQSVQLENSIAALSERTTEYIDQKYFSLNANLQIPDSVRAGRVYTGYINYSNRYMDSIAPLLIVQASNNVKLSLDPNSWEDASNSLQLLGIGNESEAGRLTTEDSGRIPFYFITSSDTSGEDISLGCLTYKDEEACPDTTYFATWKEYHEALAEAATRLNLRGKTYVDTLKAYELAVLMKQGMDANAISGTLTNELTGEAMANMSLTASWTDAQGESHSRVVTTDTEGFFSVEYLPNNVTVTMNCIGGTALSKTVFQVKNNDINKQKLTVRPTEAGMVYSVGTYGNVTAYIKYQNGALTHNKAGEMVLVCTNTGSSAVNAPMVRLQVQNKAGKENALLTLDPNLAGKNYSVSVLPEGFANSLGIIVSGKTAGTIQPGETVEIPIYWGGLLRPWDSLGSEISLGVISANLEMEIDLKELEKSMRPDGIHDTVWNIIWSRFTSIIGTTWGSYVAALGQIQKGLAANGNTVLDCAQLQQLLLAWATDMVNPMGTLTSSLDSEVRNDSNSLTWERVYAGGMLEERFLDSEMGRGWYHNWDYSLTLEDNGNVLLEFPQGIAIVYQVQKTANGKTIYYTQADVHLDLVKETDGTWTLTSQDGSIYIFAADGTLSKITDPNGNIISMAYSEGKLASVTDSWGQSLTIERNAAGKITSVTESNGRRTVYTYDKTNTYLISAAWHDGRTVSYEYETAAGNTLSVLKTITFADGTHQYFTYDDLGRVYETHYDNGLGSVRYELGNTTADLLTYKVYFGSDLQGTVYLNSLGLTAKTVDAQGRTTVYLYDDKGQLIQSVAPDSTITSYTYDEWGNLLSVTDAAGSLLGYTYTETGDLSTLTDAAGNKTLFVYDQFGNMTSMQRIDQTCTAYTYNDDGTVHTYTTRMGQTFVYSYSEDGDLLSVTLGEESEAKNVSYEYDTFGNVTKITDTDGSVTLMEYNSANQMTKVTYSDGKYFEYTYDAAGRKSSISDGADYLIQYTYNKDGFLEKVLNKENTVLTAYEYNSRGLLTKETDANGSITQYTYDVLGYLTRKTLSSADGTAISDFGYSYDVNGYISQITTLDGTWTYGYDALGQVISTLFDAEDPAEDYSAVYTYDVSGNRTSAVINGVTVNYTYNKMNQLLSDGQFTYTYNANGSLLTKTNVQTGEVWTYSWNEFEELAAVTSTTGEAWEYTYDVNGNRTSVLHTDANGSTSLTEYVYDPSGLGWITAVYQDGVLVQTYAYGNELLAAENADGSLLYYGTDHLGSVMVIVGPDGTILNEYTYDSFGNVLTSSETVENDFEFIGACGVVSDTAPDSLVHMRARYYDSLTGRFISEDPLDLAAGDTNLYRYCGNAVTMAIDPSGHITYDWGGIWRKASPEYGHFHENNWE